MYWLLLLIPFALIMSILFLKVRLCIIFDKELSAHLKILFFKHNLFPEKKEPLNPKDYSLKKLEKKQKRIKKKKTANSEQTQDKKITQISDVLDIVKIILENVMSPFGKYLKVEIAKIYVKVATNDAAKTATVYGLISQSVAYIIEILSNLTNVNVKKKNSIEVVPDFLSEKSEAKINITLCLRGWHAFSLVIKFFMGYTKHKNKLNENINSLNTQED